MEEDKQLPKTSGGCEADVSPTTAGSESSPAAAFCMKVMAIAASRGDTDYTENVATDTMIALLQSGMPQEAMMMSNAVLSVRQQKLVERQQLEQRQAAALQQQMNLNLTGGNLAVEQLKADQVTDIHHNETVNLNDKDGGKR